MAASGQLAVDEVEELVKDLQDLKAKQLIRLGKYPPLETKSETDHENPTPSRNFQVELDKENCIIEPLKILDCPRKRLLCKLALDVTELDFHIKKKLNEKITKKLSTRYCLEENFLQQHLPANSLIQLWYTEIQRIADDKSGQEENAKGNTETKSLEDKLAYNIKYEPICYKCKESVGLFKPEATQSIEKSESNVTALSFSTFHKGYCCRIKINSDCLLCRKMEMSRDEFKELSIKIDPCPENWLKLLLNCPHEPERGVKYILKSIWSWIDQMDLTANDINTT